MGPSSQSVFSKRFLNFNVVELSKLHLFNVLFLNASSIGHVIYPVGPISHRLNSQKFLSSHNIKVCSIYSLMLRSFNNKLKILGFKCMDELHDFLSLLFYLQHFYSLFYTYGFLQILSFLLLDLQLYIKVYFTFSQKHLEFFSLYSYCKAFQSYFQRV